MLPLRQLQGTVVVLTWCQPRAFLYRVVFRNERQFVPPPEADGRRQERQRLALLRRGAADVGAWSNAWWRRRPQMGEGVGEASDSEVSASSVEEVGDAWAAPPRAERGVSTAGVPGGYVRTRR